MKRIVSIVLVFLFCKIAFTQDKWEQPVWVKESPQFVTTYKGSGYEFGIVNNKQNEKLYLYKGNDGKWRSHLIDYMGREYEKNIPEEINNIIYFFQDAKGGVYLIAEDMEKEMRIYRLLSYGFGWYSKTPVSGNGFSSYFYDKSTGVIYFAARRTGYENDFSNLLIFDISWKRLDEADKNPIHNFYEKPKGIKKEVIIGTMIVNITKSGRGIVLHTRTGENFLISDFKFGNEALGTKSTFEAEKL